MASKAGIQHERLGREEHASGQERAAGRETAHEAADAHTGAAHIENRCRRAGQVESTKPIVATQTSTWGKSEHTRRATTHEESTKQKLTMKMRCLEELKVFDRFTPTHHDSLHSG